MAVIVGTFKSHAEADRAVTELVSAGVLPDTIEAVERQDSGKGEIEFKVAVDADHIDKALKILKSHGHVSKQINADLSYPDDRVSDHRRFVTENRDTSRDPTLDRDDVQIIEKALESYQPPVGKKPK